MFLCSCIIHVFRIALARSILYRLLMGSLPAAPFLIHFRIALRVSKSRSSLKISLHFLCVSDSKHWMCACCNKVIIGFCYDACNYMRETGQTGGKTSLSWVKNQQQTWPTYGVESGNRNCNQIVIKFAFFEKSTLGHEEACLNFELELWSIVQCHISRHFSQHRIEPTGGQRKTLTSVAIEPTTSEIDHFYSVDWVTRPDGSESWVWRSYFAANDYEMMKGYKF